MTTSSTSTIVDNQTLTDIFGRAAKRAEVDLCKALIGDNRLKSIDVFLEGSTASNASESVAFDAGSFSLRVNRDGHVRPKAGGKCLLGRECLRKLIGWAKKERVGGF